MRIRDWSSDVCSADLTGVDGPQIVDFERLSLSGDRRRIALDPGDRPPVAVVDYRYVAGVRCDGGKRIIRRRDQRANVGGRQPVALGGGGRRVQFDRKSTRLNSSQ